MSESEVLERLFDIIQSVLTVFSIFFTLVSGYLAALYLFLRHAPLLLRLIAFALLSFGLVFLGGVTLSLQRIQAGLFVSWSRLPDPAITLKDLLNPLPYDTATWVGFSQQHLGIATGWVVTFLVYLALAFFTFCYRWPGNREPH